MRRVLAQRRNIVGGTTLVAAAPIVKTAAVGGMVKRRHRLDHLEPTDGDFTNMHGNVWELVQDCWHSSYRGAPADGSAWFESEDGACGMKRVFGTMMPKKLF